jgi:hypothetical protein
VAQRVAELLHAHQIPQWLVTLKSGDVIVVTEKDRLHGLPSPVLRLTYTSNATDAATAAFRMATALGYPTVKAVRLATTAATLSMERSPEERGQYPSMEEVLAASFRTQVNLLPRPVSTSELDRRAGLEELSLQEQVAQGFHLFEEGRSGRGVLVVPAHTIPQLSGLEEFLGRIPGPLASSVVLWEQEGESSPFTGLEKRNPALRIFRGEPLDLAVYLAGLEEAEQVGVLGDPGLAEVLTPWMGSFGIPVKSVPWNLTRITDLLGISQEVSAQVGLEEWMDALVHLQSA